MNLLSPVVRKLLPMFKLDTNQPAQQVTYQQTNKQTGQKQYAPNHRPRVTIKICLNDPSETKKQWKMENSS